MSVGRHKIVGVDPGPIPGLVVLHTYERRLDGVEVVQCSASAFHDVLRALAGSNARIAVERYVVGRRSATSASARDGETTRDQVGALQALYPWAELRSASEVKPWATNARLEAAGLIEACAGMRHARDAARHALFAAVRADLLADPLSQAWRRTA